MNVADAKPPVLDRVAPYTIQAQVDGNDVMREGHQQVQQGEGGGAANGNVDDELQAASGIEVRGEFRFLAQTVVISDISFTGESFSVHTEITALPSSLDLRTIHLHLGTRAYLLSEDHNRRITINSVECLYSPLPEPTLSGHAANPSIMKALSRYHESVREKDAFLGIAVPDPLRLTIQLLRRITIPVDIVVKNPTQLNNRVCPKTSKNFRRLCTGEMGYGYKGCQWYRIIPGFCACSGDFETQNADRSGGRSTFDKKYFDDENYEIRHSKRGILSMDNFGWPNTNSSRFFVTFTDTPWMDNFHVAFGELVDGFDVLDKMESYGVLEGYGAQKGRTTKVVVTENCGEL